jgi:hypothetical protein
MLWCEKHATNTETVISKITGSSEFTPFNSLSEGHLKIAKILKKKVPIKMGGGGNIDLIYNLAQYTQATQVIETGVAYGWSSLAFLFSLRNRKNSILCSTDKPYLGTESDLYAGVLVPSALKPLWRYLPYGDRKAIPMALKILPEIDMCHYDSDKSVEGKCWTYPKLWNALRQGGVFISDDVGDDLAFAYFCTTVKQKPFIVKYYQKTDNWKYIGVLIKR